MHEGKLEIIFIL